MFDMTTEDRVERVRQLVVMYTSKYFEGETSNGRYLQQLISTHHYYYNQLDTMTKAISTKVIAEYLRTAQDTRLGI